jgi:uncharacterized protein
MQKLLTLLYTLTLFLLISTSQAASFDCAKAKTPLEKAICSNEKISKLDEEMSAKYQAALKSFPVKGFVRAQQREWLATDLRSIDCKKDCSKVLDEVYQKRIAMLSLPEPKLVYANTSDFVLDNGDTVAIVFPYENKKFISIWGGYRIHRQASNDAGKSIYTGCSFDGQLLNNNLAKDINGKDEIKLNLSETKLVISDKSDQVGCEGFASYSNEMPRVR